ncbi:ABC transporter ATP-binding protein [Hydrogenibacillus schlegelii]|uniref:sulfate/molybdate ABC transporter ATP-binding protein n=1 Tax=Hydrogenibacillus schlegelii TaxID=1484 RepID=UPI00082645D7|nr:ABC transporter ATP-binding protein [Hydrogenibacillus schlegelii]
MSVEVRGLWKRFGRFAAVKGIDFAVEKGKLVGLLGPSGSGKTTVLRLLAGLEIPDAGEIRFGGRSVIGVPPQKRRIGLVFQHYALFPHMTVFENIAFGLRVQKRSDREIEARVRDLLALVGLSGLERRFPQELSGGQRQRVAFARALAPEPELLLLDEPFAALDAQVRKSLRAWLREMVRRLGITTIFVTHDQEEAVEMADELIVMNEGRLEQQGPPLEVYRRPRTPFVARFLGESIEIPRPSTLKGFEHVDPDALAIVRPEFVEVGYPHELSNLPAAETGIVQRVHFRGREWQVEVAVGGKTLAVYLPSEREVPRPGDEVRVFIRRLYVFQGEKMAVVENENALQPRHPARHQGPAADGSAEAPRGNPPPQASGPAAARR